MMVIVVGVIGLGATGVKGRGEFSWRSVTGFGSRRLVFRVCLRMLLAMPAHEAGTFDVDACLTAVRTGDQAAARDLVDHLYPQVIRVVRGRLPRRMAEEDLAQEVFLKMFTRLEQYRGEMPFSHWVSRIAVTTCIDQLRRQQRRPELRWSDLSEAEADVLDAVTADESVAEAPDELAARELLTTLLSQLKPEDRMVIEMLDLEQKTLVEIAELTGWNTTLVKVRAFRARRKLRKLFLQLEASEHS